MSRATEWERSQFVYCYAWGHTWFPYISGWKPEFSSDYITLRCERCGTERREAYGAMTGEVTLRYYVWPDGYRWGRGETKPTKGELRLMAIREERKQRKEQRRRALLDDTVSAGTGPRYNISTATRRRARR